MQGYEDPMRQGSGDFVGFGGFERAMLNSAGVAIVATLPDGIITHFNPEAERMLGYRARELIGRYTPEIFHDRAEIELRARELSSEPGHEVKPGFDVFVQNTRAEKAESREWTYVRKDGSRFSVWLKVTPILDDDGAIEGYLGVARDITELKQALQAAERANRAKSEFLSRMSHELRTLLHAIIGFTRLLSADSVLDPHERETYLSHVGNAGVHLLNLINEVLDLSAIESGKMSYRITGFSTARILPDVASYLMPLLRQKRIQLEIIPSECIVRADYLRLKQSLLNLVSNAVKYSEPGGVILLTCQPASAETIRLLITDTGKGIPEAMAQKLFTPFERLGADENTEGAGIGLSITRKLIEGMGGSVGHFNNHDQGSTFWIELPLGTEESSPVDRPKGSEGLNSISAEAAATLRILLVEDNPVNAALMQAWFRRHPGYELVVAGNAAEALGVLEKNMIDIAFIDVHLPDASGFDLLRQVRSLERTRFMPVIAISADAMDYQVQAALNAGFDEYLTKPLDFDLLQLSLARWRSRLRRLESTAVAGRKICVTCTTVCSDFND